MKIIFSLLFLANLVCACVVESSLNQMDFDYPAVEINLFEENKIDYPKAQSSICENKCEKNEDSLLVYRSSQDTSLLVYLNEKQIKLFKMCDSVSDCVKLKAEYDFSPAISNVLAELGEKKLFINSFNVDSLTEHILSKMLTESYDSFSLWGEIYNYDSEDSTDIDDVDVVLTTGMICKEFCDYLDTLRQCPELITAPIPKIQPQGRVAIHKISDGFYFANHIRYNEQYRLYDLNGTLLKQGNSPNGIICAPKTPVILEISRKKFLLK